MREISVLGVAVRDYSLREALRQVQDYMKDGVLNTVCYLDMDLLMKARDDSNLKDAIEGMDLLVPGNKEILQAGSLNYGSREREVEGNFFLREVLKRLAKEKRRVFIVADTQEDLVLLREQLLATQPRLTFFGSFSYNDAVGVPEDAVINEINSVIPDVIISRVSSPAQELLVMNGKMMVNAKLWIALQSQSVQAPSAGTGSKPGFLEFVKRHIFKRAVNKFDEG